MNTKIFELPADCCITGGPRRMAANFSRLGFHCRPSLYPLTCQRFELLDSCLSHSRVANVIHKYQKQWVVSGSLWSSSSTNTERKQITELFFMATSIYHFFLSFSILDTHQVWCYLATSITPTSLLLWISKQLFFWFFGALLLIPASVKHWLLRLWWYLLSLLSVCLLEWA